MKKRKGKEDQESLDPEDDASQLLDVKEKSEMRRRSQLARTGGPG